MKVKAKGLGLEYETFRDPSNPWCAPKADATPPTASKTPN
jgi:hypothetical protein